MKIKVTFIVDTENGDYEMTFNNLSSPGEPMSLKGVKEALQKALNDVEKQPTIPGHPDHPPRNDN